MDRAIDIGGGSERFFPESGTFPHTAEQHIKRYEWACLQLRGAGNLLDVACGTGYGSHMLATRLQSAVVGVDLSVMAVNYATETYRCDGLRFIQDDALVLGKLQDSAFDGAVSFETIEHVSNPQAFIAAVRRVLRPGGRFLISTPDRRLSSVLYPLTRRPTNPHHLVEFTRREFIAIMSQDFKVTAVFGQSFVPSPLVAWPVQSALKGIAHNLGDTGKHFLERTYWRGTGTDVQPHEANKGRIANYVILSCVSKQMNGYPSGSFERQSDK
jgi:2-polyprenyl-3-methyl-5-hydroxy-6-metoxy-1,4-benzoquinol methylase